MSAPPLLRPVSGRGVSLVRDAAAVRRVLAADPAGKLEPEALNGSNHLELFVFGNAALHQAVLVARLDNLGKGASGAAVQNIGLMLGLPVQTALPLAA